MGVAGLCREDCDLGLRRSSMRLGVFSFIESSQPDLRSRVRGRGWDLADDELRVVEGEGDEGGLLGLILLKEIERLFH